MKNEVKKTPVIKSYALLTKCRKMNHKFKAYPELSFYILNKLLKYCSFSGFKNNNKNSILQVAI
jgi:hypothetical protein